MTFEWMDSEARTLINLSEQSGFTLRTVGGLAIWQRLSGPLRSKFQQVRSVPKDIDLLAPAKTSDQIIQVFKSVGFVADERLIAWHGKQRHRYFRIDEKGTTILDVDVFLGVPPLCHTIEFENRLGITGPAMTATDLLLQKLQIVETSQKDLIDMSFLFLQHELKETGDGSGINVPLIVDLLCRDWGFYYTSMQNLGKVRILAGDLLEKEYSDIVMGRINAMSSAIENAPKTMRWRFREKIGTRMQWYIDVEEVDR